MADFESSIRQPDPTPSPRDGRWALRVTEPGQPDRLAEWRDQSADDGTNSRKPVRGCTLRIASAVSDDARTQGAICTFYRGASGPRVRAWSETVLLNGQSIVDAELQPGDRLVQGNLEFEIVELPVAELTTIGPDDSSVASAPGAYTPVAVEKPVSGDERLPAEQTQGGSWRAMDVIPPREHDDAEESVEAHLERLLKRVCGEDAARDFARQRERSQPTRTSRAIDPLRFSDDDDDAFDSGSLDPAFGTQSTRNVDRLAAEDGRAADRTAARTARDVASTSGGDGARDDDDIHREAPARPSLEALRPADVKADWSGLRELANQSARAAIESHQLRGVARSARSRLSAAVLFAVSGTIGLYAIPGDQWLPLLGVLTAYGATVLWLLRTLRGARHSRAL